VTVNITDVNKVNKDTVPQNSPVFGPW